MPICINEKMLNEMSDLVKDFIEYVEKIRTPHLFGRILLTSHDDVLELVFSEGDKFYTTPLDIMPIIILKNTGRFFEPSFQVIRDNSIKEGLILFASYLEYIKTPEYAERLKDKLFLEELAASRRKREEEKEAKRQQHIAEYQEKLNRLAEEAAASKLRTSPKGREYNEDIIPLFIDECKKLGAANSDADYTIEDYLDGKRASDILHPAPRIIETRRELSSALNRFKCENGFNNIKEVAKFLRLSTSQVWSYFNCKSYPTHKETKTILEGWLNASIRKEVK